MVELERRGRIRGNGRARKKGRMRGKDREDNKNLNRKVALDYHILSCLDLTAAKFILFM